MSAGREFLQRLLAPPVELCGDLVSRGDGSATFIKWFTQFENCGSAAFIKPMQQDYCVTEITLVKGA